MDRNQRTPQAQTSKKSQDLPAEWTKIPIKVIREPPKTPGGKSPLIKPESVVLIGDYLIILAFDGKDRYNEVKNVKRNPHLLAVDLRDLSVQQVRIEKWGNSCPKYWDDYGPKCVLHQYNENQIIAFDISDGYRCSHILTIDSLSVRCECQDLKRENKLNKNDDRVGISKDCFYVTDEYRESNLWCFDPKNEIWKVIGEGPSCLFRDGGRNFVYKDNLYAYNDSSEIWKLNSDTMEWKSLLKKKKNFLTSKLIGEIYHEYLVLLSSERSSMYDEGNNQLRCWNFNTNSWKIFNVKSPGPYHFVSKLIIDKNSLWMVGGSEEGGLWLATYHLENLGLGVPMMSRADIKALFMNEKESDVKFKVEGQIIPAHKEVLIEKSRFFAGLFRSGMAETKQDVIEINDCDFDTFQEFLRFLYCVQIRPQLVQTAFKLLELADKYVQDDLDKKCLFYLKSNINSKTVFTIFEEAYAKNMQDLVDWCISYLRANITVDIISEIVESQVLKRSLELHDDVFNWIIENYNNIYLKRNKCLRLCEEFLVKNIKKETIVRISHFIAGESGGINKKNFVQSFLDEIKIFSQKKQIWTQETENEAITKGKKIFEEETMKLREEVFSFMRENWEEMNQGQIERGLPKRFLMEMFSYMFKTDENKEKARDKKRMEPNQEDNEEKPELKKTKK